MIHPCEYETGSIIFVLTARCLRPHNTLRNIYEVSSSHIILLAFSLSFSLSSPNTASIAKLFDAYIIRANATTSTPDSTT